MLNSDTMQYVFYAIIILASGVGEYFKLVPSGSLAGALLLVSGHYFGATPVKSTVTQIASDVRTLSNTPSPIPVVPDTTVVEATK